MNYINMHAHSVYSDGKNTVTEMAMECKRLGFTACVLTDHVYSKDTCSLNLNKYIDQIDVVASASRVVGIPIICGIEISVGRMEECLIFGEEAIKEILHLRDARLITGFDLITGLMTVDDIRMIRNKYKCAVIMAHPNQPKRWVKRGAADIIDGFERVNGGTDHFHPSHIPFWRWRMIPWGMKRKVQLCSSDAHHSKLLEVCYMESKTPITNEDELIDYIKAKNSFKHIINGRG